MARPWGNKAWADEVEAAAAPAAVESTTVLPVEAFPSLGEAAKTSKKKKPTAVPLAQFTTGKYVPGVKKVAASLGGSGGVFGDDNRLTSEELMMLPTGPKERTEEELNELSHMRLGGGFRNFGGDRDRDRDGRERDREQRGFGFDRERESSRADESSDWGANKSGMRPGGGRFDDERRFGGDRDRDLSSRADEVDNWGAAKKYAPSPDNSRRGFGYEDARGGGISKADTEDNWSASKKLNPSPTFRDSSSSEKWSFNKRSGEPGSDVIGGADGDRWSRKGFSDEPRRGERPRLNLQPRTLPIESPPAPKSEKREDNDHVNRLKEEIKLLKEQDGEEGIIAEKEAELERLIKEVESKARVSSPPGGSAASSWRRSSGGDEQESSGGGGTGSQRGNPWKRDTAAPPASRFDRW